MENVLRALQQRQMVGLWKDGSSSRFVRTKPGKVGECFQYFKLFLVTTFHLLKYCRCSEIQKHLECFLSVKLLYV